LAAVIGNLTEFQSTEERDYFQISALPRSRQAILSIKGSKPDETEKKTPEGASRRSR
jgi:hypothetical protein